MSGRIRTQPEASRDEEGLLALATSVATRSADVATVLRDFATEVISTREGPKWPSRVWTSCSLP
jgi:hypothetical protein